MKHTFKIKTIIKAIESSGKWVYDALGDVEGVPEEIDYFQSLAIDRAFIRLIEDNRDKVSCDIFVDALPEPGWGGGGIHVLIKPEFHPLIRVDGEFPDAQVLKLMHLVGLRKITIEGVEV